MAYITPEEMERRLQIASQRGATPEQIAQTRAKYAGSVKKKDPFLVGVGKAIVKPAVEVGRDAVGGAITAGAGAGEIYQRAVFDRQNKDKSLDKLINRGLSIMTPRGREAATSTVKDDPLALKPLAVGAQRGATTASYLVPAGKTFKGAVGTGAVAGASQGAGMDADNLEQFGGQVFAGGVGGGIGGGAMYGAGKVLTGAREALRGRANAGSRLPSAQIKGTTQDTNLWFVSNRKQQQAIADEVGLSSIQNPDEQVEVLRRGFEGIQSKIDDYLQGADPVDEDTVLDNFINRLTDTEFDDATPSQRLFLNKLLKRLTESGGSPAELARLKSTLRGELTNAFKAAERGTLPAAKDQAKKALYDSIKDSLDNISPEIRVLNNKQHTLFDLADEIGATAKSNPNLRANIPFTGIGTDLPISSGTAKTIAPKIGVGARSLIPNVGETGAGNLLRGRAGQVAGRTAGATLGLGGDNTEFVPDMPSTGGQGSTPDTNRPISPIEASELAKQGVSLSNLWVINPDGKSIWNPNTQGWVAYDSKVFGSAGAGKLTDKQRSYRGAAMIGTEIAGLLDREESLSVGPLSGRLSKIGEVLGTEAPEQTRLKSQIATARTAARNALLGANMSDRELESFLDATFDINLPLPILKERINIFVQNMNTLAQTDTGNPTLLGEE